jgi:hypothetical protein
MIAPSLAPTTAGKGPIGETGLIAGLGPLDAGLSKSQIFAPQP